MVEGNNLLVEVYAIYCNIIQAFEKFETENA